MSAKPTPLGGSKPLMAGSAVAVPRSGAQPFVTSYPVGTWTFVAPFSGAFMFVGWGAGGLASGNSGGSGAYFEITRFLAQGQSVTIVVPAVGGSASVTFPTGAVATAGSGSPATGGVATGGDVNINGSAGSSGVSPGNAGGGTGGGIGGVGGPGVAGGAGAPANLPFRGGMGGNADGSGNNGYGAAPGGGSSSTLAAGSGLVLVLYVAPGS